MDKPWLDKRITAIATQVMGWTWDDSEGAWRTHYPQGPTWEMAGWNPLERIDRAWQVAERVMSDDTPIGERAKFYSWWKETPLYFMRQSEAAEAIVLAILRAKGIETEVG